MIFFYKFLIKIILKNGNFKIIINGKKIFVENPILVNFLLEISVLIPAKINGKFRGDEE